MLNLLPWHGQLMVPPDTLPTVQPRCVHTAVNASKVPAFGWVITIFWLTRMVPPPTGTWEVWASTGAPPVAAVPEPELAAGVVAGPAWVGCPPAMPLLAL